MFPPEIFSEIFSFLSSQAHVLVACSQAHPTFAQLLEPSLYAHVIVHKVDANPEDQHHLKFKPYQLSALFSDNPRILNYLHSLRVDLSHWYYNADDEVISEMTGLLPVLKLERIKLNFADSDMGAHWELFPLAFRTAFVTCISTSYMKEICLDEVHNMPLYSFADCAGLKRLKLWLGAVPQSNRSFNFPHLEALELSELMNGSSRMHGSFPNRFFSWALTHASGLRSLTVRTPRKKVVRRFLPQLLTICSTSLANLSIYYTNPSKSIYIYLPVARIVLTLSYRSSEV